MIDLHDKWKNLLNCIKFSNNLFDKNSHIERINIK